MGQQVQATAFVTAPTARGRQANGRVVAEQAFAVGAQQVAALRLGNVGDEGVVRLRKEVAHAVQKPVNFGRCAQKNAAQYKAGAALRVGLAVSQGQCGTPGAAKHQPALDTHQFAQALNVGQQVRGGVVAHLAQGRGLARAALVKQHDAVVGWVKKLPVAGRQARARPAVQKQHRHALGVAAFFPVQRVQGVHGQVAAAVGF